MRERGAIEILEESVSCLRAASSSTIATYLVGAVPFSIGILFFWSDMVRNPFAAERLPLESLGVASLLIWKGIWRSLFAARLYRQISLSVPRRINIARLAAIHAALQPLRLIVLPVALLLTFPFVWTVAFFRNADLLAAMGTPDPIREAQRQARLWTKQNWYLLGVIALAALLSFANILLSILLLPQLARSFAGVEGDLARLGIHFLNLTTAMVAASIAWLLIDPLLETVYVIRCFHGESVSNGLDLRVALKRSTEIMALCLVFLAAPVARAQAPVLGPVTTPVPSVDSQLLHRSIQEVVRRREFAWRSPRNSGPEPGGKWVGWVQGAFRVLRRAIDWAFENIRQWLGASARQGNESQRGSRPSLKIWLAIVAVAIAVGVTHLFVRRRRALAVNAVPLASSAAAIDLANESVTADQADENSWLQLAQDLLAKGDYRLAVRALYLAGLNYLNSRELISIRRWKTGRDYRRELERRLITRPAVDSAMTSVFARSVVLFEHAWYGRDSVERADVEAFASSLEEMKRYAGSA